MNTVYSEELLTRVALSIATEPAHTIVSRWLASAPAADILDRLDRRQLPPGLLSDRITAALGDRRARDVAVEMIDRTVQAGVRVTTPGDAEWPRHLDDLARLPDAEVPWCLWIRGSGNVATMTEKSVSIVGARCCTPYGRHIATELAHQLAASGWSVVSGGPFGIDVAAHRGALAAETAPTIAVAACGVDQPYPMSHTEVFDRITQAGAIVSEHPLGCKPQRHRFLTRNRLIAALTPATVIVEAGHRSGAAYTVSQAVGLGRYVAGVPGPVTSGFSAGVHRLLRSQPGMSLVTKAAEVLDDLASTVHDPCDATE
ncbi:MAG: DNA-processing protein DprA [Stackebrandtia sp.]